MSAATLSTVIAALALAYAAFTTLAVAMPRHYRQAWGREPDTAFTVAMRLAGWALIAETFTACVLHWGWGVGVAAGFGFLSAGALAIAFTLPYRPRHAALAGAAAVPVALTALILRG